MQIKYKLKININKHNAIELNKTILFIYMHLTGLTLHWFKLHILSIHAFPENQTNAPMFQPHIFHVFHDEIYQALMYIQITINKEAMN